MEHARKMMLTEYRPTAQPITPLEIKRQNLNELDALMQDVLNSDASVEEKVTEYNDVLQRYLSHYRDDLEETSSPKGRDVEEEVVGNMPKAYRQKAASLLKRVKEHPSLGWNDRGELTFRGRTIPGTNMVDLIGDLVRRRKYFEPRGWETLARALYETNVPQDLIGHRERWDWMRGSEPATEKPRKRRVVGTPRPVKRLKWTPINGYVVAESRHFEDMEKNYYDAREPGSYGGVRPLARRTGKKKEEVEAWLKTQDTYTLHKPVRRRFPRRKTVVGGVGHQWQADLVDMSRTAKYNEGVKYLLTCIDVFSKKAWVVPLKDKTGRSLVEAFASVADPLPMRLQTDRGTEFTNRTLQKWLRERNVLHFSTENRDVKASVVERFNRTLKTKMWRYFTRNDTDRYLDVLDDLVSGYNRSVHRSIGMAPADVKKKHQAEIWQRLYGDLSARRPPKVGVGDFVRVSTVRKTFEKGYRPRWSRELFVVVERRNTRPYTFVLEDLSGERLSGTFYDQELQAVKEPDVYRIEKVIEEEKDRVLVRWSGYPSSFDSWVPRKDLVFGYKN
jgi:transposase InsO family protein